MFRDSRTHDMLKYLVEDTGQGDRTIVGWVGLIPFFFEDRGYICIFPNGREFSCVKGSLVNHLQYWSEFLMEGL